MNHDSEPIEPQPAVSAVTDAKATFRDYLDILLRRKWLALGVFFAVLALTVFSIARTLPVYEARATMMVTAKDQSDVLGKAAYLFADQPNIADHTALLASRSMAERVAAALPDTLKIPPDMLMSMVSTRAVRDANIIVVVAAAWSKPAAIAVVNAYVETYQQYDLDLSRLDVSSIRQFVEDQLGVVKARLDSSERNLAQFKSEHELTDISAETQALINRQSELAVQYQQAVVNAQGDQTELAHTQSQIEQEGRGMADVDAISSPLVSSLKATLNQLEVDKTNLIIRGYAENSERIQGLDAQIDSTRARLRIESQALIAQQGLADPVGHLSELFGRP